MATAPTTATLKRKAKQLEGVDPAYLVRVRHVRVCTICEAGCDPLTKPADIAPPSNGDIKHLYEAARDIVELMVARGLMTKKTAGVSVRHLNRKTAELAAQFPTPPEISLARTSDKSEVNLPASDSATCVFIRKQIVEFCHTLQEIAWAHLG